MISNFSNLRGIVGALALVLISGCQTADEQSQAPTSAADETTQAGATLRLSVVEQTGDSAHARGTVIVDLSYHPDAEAIAPRIAEVWLAHSPSLTYVSSEALAATTAAGKTLVVQAKAGAELRTLLYSTNLETLKAGPIARYHFTVTGSEPLWAEVLRRMPTFAPPPANVGIMLPERLPIGGSRP